MQSVTSDNSQTLPLRDASKMQLECIDLAVSIVDRYIVADNSRPSFLEVCPDYFTHCNSFNKSTYKDVNDYFS